MGLKRMRTVVVGIAAVALILPAVANAAQIGFSLIEHGDGSGNETLSISGISGAVIGGTTDNWTIDLSGAGITLSNNDLPQVWVEPTGNLVNVLSNLGDNVLGLQSELANPGNITPDNYCGTGAPLPLGTTCFVGTDTAGNDYFATVSEPAAVPEPASISLIALGLAGLAGLKFRGRKLDS
jgi:hypothetical protein